MTVDGNHERKQTTTMTTTTITEAAQEATSYFETRYRREDGERESYASLRDDRPEWVHDAVREAHAGMMPDDRIYRLCWDAFDFIAENPDTEADEIAHGFADSAVDAYTSDRIVWLGSHPSRPAFCDEAADELGYETSGIVDRIGLGQYLEATRVFAVIFAACEEQAA